MSEFEVVVFIFLIVVYLCVKLFKKLFPADESYYGKVIKRILMKIIFLSSLENETPNNFLPPSPAVAYERSISQLTALSLPPSYEISTSLAKIPEDQSIIIDADAPPPSYIEWQNKFQKSPKQNERNHDSSL